MGFFGDIIGGIAGLFGGDDDEQKVTSEVDYVKMARMARKAGFNPLTAIRNGGSAGFTTTTSPGTSQLRGVLGSLGGILGDAFDKKIDPLEAKKRERDTALVDFQLRQLKEGAQLPGALSPGATYTGTKVTRQLVQPLGPSAGRVASSAAARGPVQGPNQPGEGHIVGGDNPKASSLGLNDGRYGLMHAPWFPDAETTETVYGDNEIFSTIGGAIKLGSDAVYSVYRNAKSAYGDLYSKKATKRNKAPRTVAQRVGMSMPNGFRGVRRVYP